MGVPSAHASYSVTPPATTAADARDKLETQTAGTPIHRALGGSAGRGPAENPAAMTTRRPRATAPMARAIGAAN